MADVQTSLKDSDETPPAANVHGVQPGGGVCYRVELAWGGLRRWYLKTFRSGYVRKMEASRQGNLSGMPHEILDPRDLKYCMNRTTAHWLPADDPFAWRDRIPLVRWGLCEVQLFGWPLLIATGLLWCLGDPWRWAAVVPAVLLALVVYFFRDPTRRIPDQPNLLVAPADGKVVEITEIDDPFIGGPAVRIGIFLSIFNVHINRGPSRCRVVELRYKPGEFLNAMNPESAERNESMWIGLEEDAAPHRRTVVRQISGLIARRIVCVLRPGQTVDRGERFGMIKLGSRTELILPREDNLRIEVAIGDRVRAGSTIMAQYVDSV